MITKRQNEILKVIVEEYIRTAKPVSSNHICKKLKCSSATIRNEMVALEELHLLEKNHFASGRIPSEEGYKYYVDNLMKPKNMTGEDMLKLQTILVIFLVVFLLVVIFLNSFGFPPLIYKYNFYFKIYHFYNYLN